jgi:predicted nucleic acid-binding protein
MCWVEMREIILPSHSNKSLGPFVLDASAIINLLGTGIAGQLLSLLQVPIFAEQMAIREVIRHPIPKVDHAAELSALETGGILHCQTMDAEAREIFRELTASDLSGGLDDGEAATIAYAITHSTDTTPIVDERKATRIFRQRWPNRSAVGTAALLSDARIVDAISEEQLREAVYSALLHARMRVPPELRLWTLDLIGPERAASCASFAFGRG